MFDRFLVTFGAQNGGQSEVKSFKFGGTFSEKDPWAAKVAAHGPFVVFGVAF